jgi:hypothetical protein
MNRAAFYLSYKKKNLGNTGARPVSTRTLTLDKLLCLHFSLSKMRTLFTGGVVQVVEPLPSVRSWVQTQYCQKKILTMIKSEGVVLNRSKIFLVWTSSDAGMEGQCPCPGLPPSALPFSAHSTDIYWGLLSAQLGEEVRPPAAMLWVDMG